METTSTKSATAGTTGFRTKAPTGTQPKRKITSRDRDRAIAEISASIKKSIAKDFLKGIVDIT